MNRKIGVVCNIYILLFLALALTINAKGNFTDANDVLLNANYSQYIYNLTNITKEAWENLTEVVNSPFIIFPLPNNTEELPQPDRWGWHESIFYQFTPRYIPTKKNVLGFKLTINDSKFLSSSRDIFTGKGRAKEESVCPPIIITLELNNSILEKEYPNVDIEEITKKIKFVSSDYESPWINYSNDSGEYRFDSEEKEDVDLICFHVLRRYPNNLYTYDLTVKSIVTITNMKYLILGMNATEEGRSIIVKEEEIDWSNLANVTFEKPFIKEKEDFKQIVTFSEKSIHFKIFRVEKWLYRWGLIIGIASSIFFFWKFKEYNKSHLKKGITKILGAFVSIDATAIGLSFYGELRTTTIIDSLKWLDSMKWHLLTILAQILFLVYIYHKGKIHEIINKT